LIARFIGVGEILTRKRFELSASGLVSSAIVFHLEVERFGAACVRHPQVN